MPVLVGSIGVPLRDLDAGMQLLRRVEGVEWPEQLLVEDLSVPAHRVLDRLMELEPSRVVLVSSMPCELGFLGSVRRYVLEPTPPPVEEVHQRLVESVTLDIVDVEHTLAVLRHWQGGAERTVVIEVAPPELPSGFSFGSDGEAVAGKVLGLVHEEVVRAEWGEQLSTTSASGAARRPLGG